MLFFRSFHLAVALLIGLANIAAAAEQLVLRLRTDPQVSTSVVRLKDLVEIVSGSAPSFDKLMEMSLGPAPREGQSQTWQTAEVEQYLELRGINVTGIRWSGGTRTKLHGVRPSSAAEQQKFTPTFVDERIVAAAKNNVQIALREYLNLKSRSKVDWRIELQVPPQQAKLLQSRRSIVSIAGGDEPWFGEQTFVLQIKQGNQLVNLEFDALVEVPPAIVVAVGPLRRDQLLTSEMLTYGDLPSGADESQYFVDVNSIVGKQLRRSVSTNQAITADYLGDPIVVHRSELVEVESVVGAIAVKTSGKSLMEGAIGDLIDVEMSDRSKLKATVVATGVVRVAGASTVAVAR